VLYPHRGVGGGRQGESCDIGLSKSIFDFKVPSIVYDDDDDDGPCERSVDITWNEDSPLHRYSQGLSCALSSQGSGGREAGRKL